MREFRKAKGVTEHYTSLEALRTGWGLAPVGKKRPKDENILQQKREKFLGTCRVCKKPLSLIEGCNVLTCKNPECKGVKMTSQNEDGTEKVWYVPVSRVLDEVGFEISMNLFD